MLMKRCDERVMIFIDGSNIYHIIKNILPDKKPNEFNFEKFAKHLAEDRKLIRTYYYNAPLDRNKDEDSYIKQQDECHLPLLHKLFFHSLSSFAFCTGQK